MIYSGSLGTRRRKRSAGKRAIRASCCHSSLIRDGAQFRHGHQRQQQGENARTGHGSCLTKLFPTARNEIFHGRFLRSANFFAAKLRNLPYTVSRLDEKVFGPIRARARVLLRKLSLDRLSVILVASYAREFFGQFRTLKLRKSARKQQRANLASSQITTVLPHICGRIAQ